MPIDLTRGAAREPISAAEESSLRRSGVLVSDPRRERPRYFDGRFLAARDLIRDQQYFLTREADLGRSAGSGVASGLNVNAGSTPQSLTVAAGQGVTPAGELVLLPRELTLNLADIPLAEQLSARFGLARIPAAPMRSRTGLFVLALRPVEFSANPVGAYPTSITGPRTVEDGDIVEATAVVLVPWQDDGGADALQARRGRAARTLFVQGQGAGSAATSANLLPLAMLALQGNSLVWIDEGLVRRELGADRGDLPGLGFSPRALRVAHLLQYQEHLADVVAMLRGRSFAAATQFQALPPSGPLPPGTIDPADFSQRYFPSEVDVDFSVIPDDELPALIEESLALPPIDLLAAEAALDRTAVLVLAPVPRADFRAVLARLASRSRPLKPAAPNRLAQQKPLEILQRLRLPLPVALPDAANPSDAEWMRLARLANLWYVRRRNLAYRDDLAGAPVPTAGRNDIDEERAVRGRIERLGLAASLDRVLARASTQAAAGVITLLATPRLAGSPALSAAAIGALAARSAPPSSTESDAAAAPGLSRADVLGVAAELAGGGLGDGLVRLERASAEQVTKVSLQGLAGSDAWRKLDASALAAAPEALGPLAGRLRRGAAPPREPPVDQPADRPVDQPNARPPAGGGADAAAPPATKPTKPARPGAAGPVAAKAPPKPALP